MIQIYFVTENARQAMEIAQSILKNNLAAAVRVSDNQSYYLLGEQQTFAERKVFLVTGLTKALLFNDCLNFVHDNFGKNIFIYSIPITQANEALSDMIRNFT